MSCGFVVSQVSVLKNFLFPVTAGNSYRKPLSLPKQNLNLLSSNRRKLKPSSFFFFVYDLLYIIKKKKTTQKKSKSKTKPTQPCTSE